MNAEPSIHIHSRRLRFFTLAAAASIYLLIIAGGVVGATGSAGACPDWPTCFGAWTPPAGNAPLIDYIHRAATVPALLLTIGAVLTARRERPRSIAIQAGAWGAAAMLGIQVLLGASLALGMHLGPPRATHMLHLVLSLLALAAISLAAVLSFYPRMRRFRFETPFARLTLVIAFLLLALMTGGGLVQSGEACSGWPLCTESLGALSPAGWLHLAHRLIVGAAGLAVGAGLWLAWKTQRSSAPTLVAATALGVLFFSQALLGAKMVQGFPSYLLGLHQATAGAVWAAAVILAAVTGLSGRTREDERQDAAGAVGRTGMLRDLIMLTKPIVVVLLLVTTFAGMVIGAQRWPPLWITIWTLIGGFMAAGGSGAINQYIDRDDDLRMQRTQKRPIPSGRLTPAEGLAFGVGMALASFFLMTAAVNFLAALLSLAGIFYYVLLYSIFLKKTTVQNIVIGGGAGAIPPLVGWAAATGSLNFPSLFLFAIVFMWTPPHFWALALVRRSDYARAGVPMLPVVRGEAETRRQILIYTLELVGLSLLLPVFGLGGSVYFVGALMLGGWLLAAAWKVWKQGGNKPAWKMYRYSSMYLAFLFAALMVDRLL